MLFLFISHFIGHYSDVVPVLNVTLAMSLNIILAIVCIGYVTSALIPFMPMYIAVSVSVLLLLSALPFEFLDAKTQNSHTNIKEPSWKKYPVLGQIFMLVMSLLGGIQYLIRNFNLVRNFTKSRAGVAFILGIQRSGYFITAAQFSIMGGLAGLLLHFLLAYSKWDEYTKFHEKSERLTTIANYCWQLFPLLLLIPYCGLWNGLAFGIAVKLVLNFYSNKEESSPPIIKPKANNRGNDSNSFWFKSALFSLPLGASLYALVDYNNSYAVITQLGWMNHYTFAACCLFGALSFFNTVVIWGYNTVRFMHGGEKQKVGRKVDSNLAFVRLYFSDHSIRRLSGYIKEGLLCVLDVLGNRLVLVSVNQILFMVFGVSIGLMALNISTACYSINKVIINKFQSAEENVSYVTSEDYKDTWLAGVCKKTLIVLDKLSTGEVPVIFSEKATV